MPKLKIVIAIFLLSLLTAKALPTAEANPTAFNGTVIEQMESGGYVYLHVENETETRWFATQSTDAVVGDTVTVAGAMEMRDFTSKTLDRTFEVIYFTGRVRKGDGESQAPASDSLPAGHPSVPSSPANALPEGHPSISPSQKAATKPVSIESLTKPEGYVSIAECYDSRDTLEGQTVRVRGIVSKYSSGILGSNWVRLKDGTGTPGKDYLMATTQAEAEIGQAVDVEGVLKYDYDLGSGYLYPVIINDAKLSLVEIDDPDKTEDPD